MKESVIFINRGRNDAMFWYQLKDKLPLEQLKAPLSHLSTPPNQPFTEADNETFLSPPLAPLPRILPSLPHFHLPPPRYHPPRPRPVRVQLQRQSRDPPSRHRSWS